MGFWNYLGLAIVAKHFFGKKSTPPVDNNTIYEPSYDTLDFDDLDYDPAADKRRYAEMDARYEDMSQRITDLERRLSEMDSSAAGYDDMLTDLEDLRDDLDDFETDME